MKQPLVLEVQDLKKRFRNHFWSAEQEILKGLDFTVPQGSVTGFLGPNGAGKTTAFKCLFRLIKRDTGNIRFFGESDWTSALKSRLGFLQENPSFYEETTLRETLLFLGRLSLSARRTRKEILEKRAEFLMEKLGLLQEADKPLRSFSKGMTQKAGLLQAFIHSPDFAILDEPFSGLDPEGRAAAFSLIEDMKREGRTVLLSSHILPDMERLCGRLLILKEGRIVFQGTKEDLIRKAEGSGAPGAGSFGGPAPRRDSSCESGFGGPDGDGKPAIKPGEGRAESRRNESRRNEPQNAGNNGGFDRRRIVFLKKGRQDRLQNLSFSECQKEIDRLRKEKCDILSLERERPDLESAFQKILSGS